MPLFDTTRYVSGHQGRSYDVGVDGHRFLFIKDQPATGPSIVVEVNWAQRLSP